jgi:hemerythrin-like domain-containing protein
MVCDNRERNSDMHNVIERLCSDHQHMGTLLDVLERELDIVERAGNADFAIMRDTMQYLTRYSDKVHHPMEDLVYARLADRSPKARMDLAPVPEQHERIAREGSSLLDAVSMVADGGMTLRARILRAGRRYVADLRKHIEMEEAHLFPLALSTLDRADLAEVERILDEQKDPVFGDVVQADFEDLYAHIRDEMN